ncbi:hypothetical protein DA2_1572 [Desulfovibrio sp. A2]|nr:hypothetical protein DA2_1572 [Desulfovibrio sp. A2]
MAQCGDAARGVVTHSAQRVVKAARRVGRCVWPVAPDAS